MTCNPDTDKKKQHRIMIETDILRQEYAQKGVSLSEDEALDLYKKDSA